jgi:membrane glycosyltransferase
MRRSARRSYGGGAQFAINVASEIFFSFLLSPVMALTHTGFMARLFLMRRGGAWNNQKRESHAVPWPLAWAKLWPHTLTGFALIGLVAATSPGEIGYALMVAGGLALSAPFAVVTAEPRVGNLLSRFGVARIPEETAPSAALLSLHDPDRARASAHSDREDDQAKLLARRQPRVT